MITKDNELEQQHLNGPCMLHGRFDCLDCCPELDDYDEPTDPIDAAEEVA